MVGAIFIAIFSGLFVACVMLASPLGLINWGRSEKQAIAKADQMPGIKKTTRLEEDDQIDGIGRHKIEIQCCLRDETSW
ncbi:uncharacterized protein N7479_005687 [Penicillium vulpinum]|uniref:uncharacterized protein n=1 Tax=Penicillium vulpinum TaxID=29845 RepID=UPI0025476C88|nr:uncharacterized protein N7479_005687 [Penicillium vulpinum]KAJ5958537.1 hypothetical protein N7479_005687 [Penicillium vulpinum]